MLEIKGITKIYDTGSLKQTALDKVSINFRESEFASILGPSGSGKTTLLNIIGGLDHYTSGDLKINEVSTKKFKDKDWDSYRNHRIGFVFQSYNLIPHQTILQNVKLALTLSGISKKEATTRAKRALKDVGLEKHIDKRPNQLSGGQMQRVAIARALVNDPEILLADEPTGALDSETSVQIMQLLKQIAKKRLVIMVTHNPDLAKEYSTRIIKLQDGKIIADSDPYDGKVNTLEQTEYIKNRQKKTKMSFATALSLSFKNLLTKKGRTILVAFAGSIGIIGIALILAVSTGFQNYVDHIQESTLSSYPLSLTRKNGSIVDMLLTSNNNDTEVAENTVTELQNVTNLLGHIGTNDLTSFKKYYEQNSNKLKDDILYTEYNYSIDPLIYSRNTSLNKLEQLNPNTLFDSFYGGSSILSSYSSLTSVYQQYDSAMLAKDYSVLAGRMPEKYNEIVVVLLNEHVIPELLVYSLGLRDMDELSTAVTSIMSGKDSNIKNDPLTLTYDDILNIDLRLIYPTDVYKYNSKYGVYENMSSNAGYMNDLYNKSEQLHIVGIVQAKENSILSNSGIFYTPELITHIINHAADTDAVKAQLKNPDFDIFSGKNFDAAKNDFNFKFSDLVSVDTNKLQSMFSGKIDQNVITRKVTEYMNSISADITTDIAPARTTFITGFDGLAAGLQGVLPASYTDGNIAGIVSNYLTQAGVNDLLKPAYSSLLQTVLKFNLIGGNYNDAVTAVKTSAAFATAADTVAAAITKAQMQQAILTKVGGLTEYLTSTFASSMSIDPNALASAFKLNFTEDELVRVISAMFTEEKASYQTNLTALGYQELDEPTMINFYFTSFEGKENFINFLDSYNDDMAATGKEDSVIEYSDTTGILMNSVKTIVDAVSYVLIAFVSISLIVSSIMIGIITYISVYERKKEIGILRAIGASKRNISNIFNAETFIIGLLSGLFGIGISYLLIPIINTVLHHFTGDIPLSATLAISSAGILVIISIILTLIGGLIPARSASKKDPVEALRSE